MSRRSIAIPSANILQICSETSNFTEIDVLDPTNGEFLTLRGSPTGYYYVAIDSAFVVYKYEGTLSTSRQLFKHNFGNGFMVMGAKYFRLDDDHDGVVVLAREARVDSRDYSYLAYFSFQSRKLLKCCGFNGRLSHLEVCIDGRQREELKSMKEALHSMQNMIVVGGSNSVCFLVNMGDISEENSEPDVISTLARKIPLLKPNEEGLIEYNPIDNRSASRAYTPSQASVTSIAYMHERGLINFQVERLAIQHPSDDHDNYLYLWAQIRNGNRCILFLLGTVQQETNTGGFFMARFSYTPPNCQRFMQMRTVVLDKRQAMAIGSLDKADDEENGDSSFAVREHARFNQLMFFLYTESVGTQYRLRGSVFDMDAWYSKRMPREASGDRTISGQCGFLSHFCAQQKLSNLTGGNVMDALMTKIGRFEPPGSLQHIDQLFYPSALYFSLEILSDTSIAELRVIDDISKRILKYYRHPDGITRFLHAIGLCNSLASENENVMRACLFRILLHNYFPGCLNFVEMDEVDEEMLNFFHKWLGKEVEQTKTRFDEESRLLYDMPPKDVLRSTMDFVDHSQIIFQIMKRLKMNKKICEDLLLQISAILFGSHMDLLRDTPEQEERMNKLRLKFAERRNIAIRLSQSLEIHKIFDGVIEASRGVQFFDDLFGKRSSSDLYPPDSYIDLLDVLSHLGITTSAKLQIIGYYAKDMDAIIENANERKYFQVACGYLLNDKISDEAMNEMQNAWNMDQKLIRIDKMCGVPGMDELKRLSETEEKPYEENDLQFMPVTNTQEQQKLLGWIFGVNPLYNKLPYGVHKFNMDMISRRRYEMIVDPPAQTEKIEPEFVQTARKEVARIKRDFAHIFVRNTFEQEILDKCKEKLHQPPRMHVEPLEKDRLLVRMQSPNPLLVQQNCGSASKLGSFTNFLAASSPANRSAFFKAIAEDGDAMDENTSFKIFPPRGLNGTNLTSTPTTLDTTPTIHAERFSDLLPKLTPPSKRPTAVQLTTPISTRNATNQFDTPPAPSPYINREGSALLGSSFRQKELDRLARLVTPQSVRLRKSRSRETPRSSSHKRTAEAAALDLDQRTPPQRSEGSFRQPTSILRTNKRPRMHTEERSITFGNSESVHLIPSNQENRDLAQAESSFNEFVTLSDTSGDDTMLKDVSVFEKNPSPEMEVDSEQVDEVVSKKEVISPEVENEVVMQSESELTPEPEPTQEKQSDIDIESEVVSVVEKEIVIETEVDVVVETKTEVLVEAVKTTPIKASKSTPTKAKKQSTPEPDEQANVWRKYNLRHTPERKKRENTPPR
ncbi:Protein ELYS [Aphelenchoides besseyi]|nr:Protein ELYS [Aphelenchoides besseyi]